MPRLAHFTTRLCHNINLTPTTAKTRRRYLCNLTDSSGAANDHDDEEESAILLRRSVSSDAGRQIHARLILKSAEQNSLRTIFSFYLNSGRLHEARQVFDRIPQPNADVGCWNRIIGAYACSKSPVEALFLYQKMLRLRIPCNNYTYPFLLKACASAQQAKGGQMIHARLLKIGLICDVLVGSALIDMYGKCAKSSENARKVFEEMPAKDVVSWNSLIAAYANDESIAISSLVLLKSMIQQGFRPSEVTFLNALRACARTGVSYAVSAIHCFVFKCGFDSLVPIGTALLHNYFQCGDPTGIVSAEKVFTEMPNTNHITWTAMISGYAQLSRNGEAFRIFQRMQQWNCDQSVAAAAVILKACANEGKLLQGQSVHAFLARSGRATDLNIGNSLIAMYAKCGRPEMGFRHFQKMPHTDVISWNAMIAGFTQNGCALQALKLFQEMLLTAEAKPDVTTLKSALPSCAQLSALQLGRRIHAYMLRNLSFGRIEVSAMNSLLDMYAKCGQLALARKLFDRMPDDYRDIVSWNSMILGYGLHGFSREAISLFCRLDNSENRLRPDDVTFISVLISCTHAGLVSEGRTFFQKMVEKYKTRPRLDHYMCMVDLLGRAGHLQEALDLIKSMEIEPDSSIWGALLGACRIHKNLELAEHVEKSQLQLGSASTGCFVLLSNMYCAEGRWQDAERVRKQLKVRGLRKNPGQSWIEIKHHLYCFGGGDVDRERLQSVNAVLDNLLGLIRERGYVAERRFVMQDVEDEEKEHIVSRHSEKLALAFGIVQTCPATALHITNNLRACGDCHTAFKFFSEITEREIVLRDINRFHQFKGGHCSCGDYW